MKSFALSVLLVFMISSQLFSVNANSLDIEYTDDNNKIKNIDNFIGKPLLVDTFATWCEPCKVEMAHLKEIYDKARNTLTILSLSVSPNSDTPSKVRNFRNDFDAKWEFGIDHEGKFTDIYKVTFIPSLYLFNADGDLIKVWEGVTDAIDIAAELKTSLNIDLGNIDYSGFDAIGDQIQQNNLLQISFSLFVIAILYTTLVPSSMTKSKTPPKP